MLSRPRVCRDADIAEVPLITARVPAVISSPDLSVFAVAAAGVCVLFPTWWMRYLNSVSAARPTLVSLSLLFLELNSYCVNAVRLHVYAADMLVRRGVDRDDFR